MQPPPARAHQQVPEPSLTVLVGKQLTPIYNFAREGSRL